MKFTLESCQRVLDAADALLTTLSARGTVFQLTGDKGAAATALEALRQGFVRGSLTPKPLAPSVYVHVLEAPWPLKRSILVTSPFPSLLCLTSGTS